MSISRLAENHVWLTINSKFVVAWNTDFQPRDYSTFAVSPTLKHVRIENTFALM